MRYDIEIFNFLTWKKRTKKVSATKNVIKDKMTGRVYILWRIVEIIAKKLKSYMTKKSGINH